MLKSATTLWVKNSHLVALQLSNAGLPVEFIASKKLINQTYTNSFLIVQLSRMGTTNAEVAAH